MRLHSCAAPSGQQLGWAARSNRTSASTPMCRDGDSSYTTTFNNTAAGTYTLRLTAVNDNQLVGSASTTGDVIVGVPGQPRLAAATGSVGKATIGWETAISDPNPGECPACLLRA